MKRLGTYSLAVGLLVVFATASACAQASRPGEDIDAGDPLPADSAPPADIDAAVVDAGEELGGIADTCEVSDCDDGFRCVQEGDAPNFCRRICESDQDCAGDGDGAVCRLELDDTELCTYHCDASADTTGGPCSEDRACYFFPPPDDGGPDYNTDCREPGDADVGQLCEDRTDCIAGHTCVDVDSTSECLRTCIVGTDPDPCPVEGEVCTSFSSPEGGVNVGDREYGVCFDGS